jgi:hypothetical protein
MNQADKSPTIIIREDSDSLEELSEYLDVLSSSARPVPFQRRSRPAMKILKNILTSS